MSANQKKETKETLLIVEDDRSLREGLAMNLRPRGYEVLTASDAEEGLERAFNARPDLIVLDLMMPKGSGLDILEELRRRGEHVPVLILSARKTTPDKVRGLDLGADDYMSKPFDLPELMARIEAMLRRRRTDEQSLPDIEYGSLTIDRSGRVVRIGTRTVELSAREFDVLCLLANSPGQVFTRDAILERVWGWDYEGTTRTVDNYVAALRKKLRIRGRPLNCIHTVPRVGYKFQL